MASYEIMDRFEIHRNEDFLKKARELTPVLQKKTVIPTVVKGESKGLRKGDRLFLDFGDHYVGYLRIKVSSSGSHQDAPAFIRLRLAEREAELSADPDEYNGWISKGWIQEEWLHIDLLPDDIRLKRRYAFRYLEIEVLDTSQKFSLNVDEVTVEAASAVSVDDIELPDCGDKVLNKIMSVGAYTLQECMQEVFEDGPKRDRRLWLGDLRLQAMADYVSFKNYEMVKRCLYLFGGLPFNDDRISACLFTEPEYASDDTYLMDYALFFVCVLYEYYEATKDMNTVYDLYDIAMHQIENTKNALDERGIVRDLGDAFWCFVDWSEGLNKQASAQAVFIYAVRYGIRLAELMDDDIKLRELRILEARLKAAAIEHLWDDENGLFVSGEERQISYASQVWMILAEVLEKDKAEALMQRTMTLDSKYKMVTPYMYHYYIEALILTGKKDIAISEIKRYWGGMINAGADTFWELYNPDNPEESPYGSCMVNSYCHAWSCTPVYLLQKIL